MPMLLQDPVAVRSLVESITARLEQAILAGDLPLGSKINEQVIARDLGVSQDLFAKRSDASKAASWSNESLISALGWFRSARGICWISS